jgi:hypothetical protein
MEHLGAKDIVAFLQAAEKWVGDELDLEKVQVDDRVLVRTQNTSYLLRMTGPHTAHLVTDRPDRPDGAVRVEGCAFGRSHMIKPHHLFCGGSMEFKVEQNQQTYTTSPILALQWISRSRPEAKA